MSAVDMAVKSIAEAMRIADDFDIPVVALPRFDSAGPTAIPTAEIRVGTRLAARVYIGAAPEGDQRGVPHIAEALRAEAAKLRARAACVGPIWPRVTPCGCAHGDLHSSYEALERAADVLSGGTGAMLGFAAGRAEAEGDHDLAELMRTAQVMLGDRS